MIVGAILTIRTAFLYDTWATGSSTVTTGSPSNLAEHRTMVNWDVVGENVRSVSRRAREAWTTLSHKVTS
jgi:hypothetical protein